jgi:hypothetical protein
MDYDAVLAQVLALLQQEQRVAYRVLKRRLQLDAETLEDLKDDLIYAKKLAVDEDGRVLVWTGDTSLTAPTPSPSATTQERAPLTYIPSYLAEKILMSRSALEGERKLVTVLFADLKGSTELIRDLDPEAAQKLLDPALQHMMEAVQSGGACRRLPPVGSLASWDGSRNWQPCSRRWSRLGRGMAKS